MSSHSKTCEVCNTREGTAYKVYYGNVTREETSYSTTTKKTTKGEYEQVILCDQCINEKIAKTINSYPKMCLAYMLITGTLGIIFMILSILNTLGTLLLGSNIFAVLIFLGLASSAAKYNHSEKEQKKAYQEEIETASQAKKLRRNKLQGSSYNVFFSQKEYDTIVTLDRISPLYRG